MTQQTIYTSRGDNDLVVLVVSVPELRFRANLAAAVIKIGLPLVGATGAITLYTPTTDVMLNAGQREVTLRVGVGQVPNPAAGTYAPKAQITSGSLIITVDSGPDTVLIA